jgi:hypothetical protein
MAYQVSPTQAFDLIKDAVQAGLTAMLSGSPGIGKSSIFAQVADYFNLGLIDVRLAQCDPTDLNGFPTKMENGKASYMPMDTFPIQGDDLPENKDGWMILLDELTSAPKAVQAAAYKLILDRQVGQHKLHDNVVICAAGNLATDNAVVHKMSTALRSRMLHLELSISKDDWVEWALKNNIDHRIVSYIEFSPKSLYTFNPEHSDNTYSCPRTLEFASRLFEVWGENIERNKLPLLIGTLGEAVGHELFTFSKVYSQLPSFDAILQDPINAPVSKDPSVNYALTGVLYTNADGNNLPKVMDYIERLPIEFQVITLKGICTSKPVLGQHSRIMGWLNKNAQAMA